MLGLHVIKSKRHDSNLHPNRENGVKTSLVRILAITGSPRPNGHTAALLESLLSGAEEAGAQIERIDACQLQIAGCSGCNACAHTGECILQDDMQAVFQRMGSADVIVLASPLYFMGISGQLKLLVDRCQTCWNRRYELHTAALLPPKQRRGFFLCTGGAPNKRGNNFEPAIRTATYFFDALAAKYLGELTAADTDRSPVHEQTELLAKARIIGLRLGKEELA